MGYCRKANPKDEELPAQNPAMQVRRFLRRARFFLRLGAQKWLVAERRRHDRIHMLDQRRTAVFVKATEGFGV